MLLRCWWCCPVSPGTSDWNASLLWLPPPLGPCVVAPPFHGKLVNRNRWISMVFDFLFLVSLYTDILQFLKRKQRVEKWAWLPGALCWVSVHLGRGGGRRGTRQAFGDVFSTLICGSTSLWELWVPRWGFYSGSPARPRGSPDTWRTPSSSCGTLGQPPCFS